MSICIVTQKTAQAGQNRSHARNSTKRKFNVNLHRKTYVLSSGKKVSVDISAHGIRIIDKKGIGHLEALLNESSESN